MTELVNAGVVGPGSKTVRNLAGELAAMAQSAIAWRNGTHEGGQVLAKTNYAKIISLAAARTTTPIQTAHLLAALLAGANAYLPPGTAPVAAHDPVSPHQLPGIDLTRATFQQWVHNVAAQPLSESISEARRRSAGPTIKIQAIRSGTSRRSPKAYRRRSPPSVQARSTSATNLTGWPVTDATVR